MDGEMSAPHIHSCLSVGLLLRRRLQSLRLLSLAPYLPSIHSSIHPRRQTRSHFAFLSQAADARIGRRLKADSFFLLLLDLEKRFRMPFKIHVNCHFCRASRDMSV